MATLKSQIQGLIDYANETTGAGDTLLGDAVKTLCDGYGQGGGGLSDLGYNGHINTAQLAAQGWTQAQIDRLVSKIWWNEDDDEWYDSNLDKFYHYTGTSGVPPSDAIAVVFEAASYFNNGYFLRNYFQLQYFDNTDVHSWKVGGSQMFNFCTNLRVCIYAPLQLTDGSQYIQSSFAKCYALQYLKFGEAISFASNSYTPSAFSGLSALTRIEWEAQPWNIAGDASSLFNEWRCIQIIDLDAMRITLRPSNIQGLFYGCPALREVRGIIDAGEASGVPFTYDNYALREFRLKGLKTAMNVSGSPLSHDTLVYLLTNLKEVSGTKLTLGSANLAKLTDAEKSLATSKGWTLA